VVAGDTPRPKQRPNQRRESTPRSVCGRRLPTVNTSHEPKPCHAVRNAEIQPNCLPPHLNNEPQPPFCSKKSNEETRKEISTPHARWLGTSHVLSIYSYPSCFRPSVHGPRNGFPASDGALRSQTDSRVTTPDQSDAATTASFPRINPTYLSTPAQFAVKPSVEFIPFAFISRYPASIDIWLLESVSPVPAVETSFAICSEL